LTAIKFKPLAFSMSGFALPYIEDFSISMILYDSCQLLALLYYIIVNVWNIETLMQFADPRVPWKIANSAENLALQSLQF
jgi:hypothetical protein